MIHVDRLIKSLRDAAHIPHEGEAVSELQHALQTAECAADEGADKDLVLAALLHEIGRYVPLPKEIRPPRLLPGPEQLSADLIEAYVPPRITWCIRHHVTAKRYLLATQRGYVLSLSSAARRDLACQNGPLNNEEVREFAAEAWALDALQLRRWCDRANVPGRKVKSLDEWESELRRVFARSF